MGSVIQCCVVVSNESIKVSNFRLLPYHTIVRAFGYKIKLENNRVKEISDGRITEKVNNFVVETTCQVIE